MSARDTAIAAVAEDIAVRMTERHESLPEATYKRFLDSNRGVALIRAREAVTALELAGLMIVEAGYPEGCEAIPAGPGDAFHEEGFYLGSILPSDLRVDTDVNDNGYADTVHHPAPVAVPIPKTTATAPPTYLGLPAESWNSTDFYGGQEAL